MNKKKLFEQVDKILWEDWDPIGVNNSSDGEDEYRGYVPSIIKLLIEGADVKKITKRLFEHANVNMGMSSIMEDHEKVAKKLRALI